MSLPVVVAFKSAQREGPGQQGAEGMQYGAAKEAKSGLKT